MTESAFGPAQSLSLDLVRIVAATEADAPLLANLLELYTHDLSDVFPHVVLGTDGRFGYPRLADYWRADGQRAAYVIWIADRVAGFALMTGTHDNGFDVAEFFVIKQFRGTGVAQRAAHHLWAAHPGRWTVRVSVRNVRALRFWTAAIEATTGRAPERALKDDWHIFRFTMPGTA